MHYTFGQWLKEKRLQAGLSQEEVSRGLGFKRLQVYSNIERDKMALPMLKWPRICSILHIEYGTFIEVLRQYDSEKVAEYEEFVRHLSYLSYGERLIAS